jgi:hypothetical protein
MGWHEDVVPVTCSGPGSGHIVQPIGFRYCMLSTHISHGEGGTGFVCFIELKYGKHFSHVILYTLIPPHPKKKNLIEETIAGFVTLTRGKKMPFFSK